jgi:putative serine protease PepD
MSGGEMADEDRSAAPDDPAGRHGRDESGSDWFFRDRGDDSVGEDENPAAAAPEPYGAHGPGDDRLRPGPSGSNQPEADRPGLDDTNASTSQYYGPFGGPTSRGDEPTQVIPPYGSGTPSAYGSGATSAYGSGAASSYGSGAGSAYGSGPAPSFGPPTGYPVGSGPSSQPPAAPVGPAGPPAVTPARPARRPRAGLLLLVAALLAALVGTAAGYGGARLAQTGAPVPTGPPSTGTTTAPQPTRSGTPAPSGTPASPAPSQIDTVQVAASALPSTVMIRVGSNGSGGTGSGFVLDTEGHIMTNNHVIADAADGGRITVVFSDGARKRAELVGRSPSYDLAVIKLTQDHDLTPMPVGDSDQVQVGAQVVAIGSPLALASTVTQGIVSAKNRPVVVNSDGGADAPSAYINGIQTDAAINPGNSGGPLVDSAARVIGVNSAILTLGQSRTTSGNIGLGFAIPINQAMEIGKLLITDGKATYPVIGVNLGDPTSDGVRLSEVDGGGPADDAGLRVDDVVTAVNDQPVSTAQELIVAVRTHRPGDRVRLTYERGGQQRTADVTLGSREG